MTTRLPTTRGAAVAGSLLLLLGGLAGCGDDPGSTATPVDESGAVDLAAFCDAYASSLQAAITGDADGEAQAVQGMIDAGPPTLAGPLARYREAIEAEGQEAAHEQSDAESRAQVGAVARTCQGEELELVAFDHGFEDVPDLTAGRHLLTLRNTSEQEEHQAVVLRKKAGVTVPADELFGLPEDQVESMITPVTFLHSGNKGETWVVDLEPGEYIVACFLPVGGDPTAPPHMAEGMLTEFTVTA